MPEAFDPYYRWLGIPPDEQPADHYRLLGIKRFETDPAVIETAADRQMVHLRTFQIGPQAELSERLLSEVAASRACLLEPAKKAVYDSQLRERGAVESEPGGESLEPLVHSQLESLLAEADAVGPSHLARLPRRQKSLRPWLVGGVVLLVLATVVAGLVSVVSWSMGRLRTVMDDSSRSNQQPAPPIGGPMVPPVAVPAAPVELTGSAEKSVKPPLRLTLTGHTRPVVALAFLPNGRHLATGSKDGSVRLWKVDSGRMLWARQEHAAEVNSLAFRPDGGLVASAGDDHTIRIWDPADGQVRRTIATGERGIRAIAFSLDGRWLASAGHDRTIRLWNPDSGEPTSQWDAHDDSVMALAFSPDGQLLASGSLDRSVRLWDPASGRRVRTLAGHEGAVRSLAFGPDGKWLVSVGEDDRWIAWNVATGEPIVNKPAGNDRVLAVAVSPDGKTIATAGRDAAEGIRLWDTTTGVLRATLPGHTAAIGVLAFSPDGQTLASGGYDRVVKLWQVEPAAQ